MSARWLLTKTLEKKSYVDCYSEVIYTEIFEEIAAKHGKTVSMNDVKSKLLGLPEKESGRAFIEAVGLPITPEQFVVDLHEVQKTKLQKTELLPGAGRLICHCNSTKIPMACASSSSMESIELKITKHKDLFACMNHIVAGSDPELKRGKPAPDIFWLCASRFPDCPPSSKCLVIEDAPNGVRAALSAGMQVVLVPDPHLPPDKTICPTLVLKSLCDFKPELFCLPAFPPGH